MGAGSAIGKLQRMVGRRGAVGVFEWCADLVFWRAYHTRLWYRRMQWNAVMRRSGDGLIVADVQGLRLSLNPEDRGLSMELAAERMHEPILTSLWQMTVQSGMTVVDVGANLGYFALLAARSVGETGKVIAVEPAPDTIRFLRQNVQENRATNVTILECAVGATSARQPLYVFEQANWNSLAPRGGSWRTTEVSVEPLDRLLDGEHRVDVIRMDVEGAEVEVVGGMARTLAKCHPVVVMEMHQSFVPHARLRGMLQQIGDAGYVVRWAFPRRWDEVLWMRRKHARAVRDLLAMEPCRLEDFPLSDEENYTVCFAPAPDLPTNAMRPES